MSNPVVLITGALTGIGRAAAVAFAKKGAKVAVAGRRDEAGKELVKELRSLGAEAEFIKADVRKEDDVRAMVDKTVARFGRIDVAVNNAATEGQVGPINEIAYFVLMANVGADELRFGAEPAQLARELLAGVLVAAGNHEPGAFLGKSQSGGSADPGECAGDQDNGVAHKSSPSGYDHSPA